jgi:cytochrome b
VLLIAQVTLGLFAVDVDGIESGPLSHLVSFDAGRTCARWHETTFDALVVFIVLHILAVLFYLVVRRDNLIKPMITGVRERGRVPVAPAFVSPVRAVLGVLVAGFFTWAVSIGLWT